MGDPATITGYHAHIYFDDQTRDTALAIRDQLAAFPVELGRVHDKPVGPHPTPMYQVAFAVSEFARVVPWLMLNRRELSILVHPETGNAVADHSVHPLWLGTPQVLDIELLRSFGG